MTMWDCPAPEVQKMLDAAAKSEYTLSIALPGEVESTNADAQDGTVCTWNLKYGEERRIELSTSNVFEGNVAYYNMLTDAHGRDTLFTIGLAALAVVALLAAAIFSGAARPQAPRLKSGCQPHLERSD